MSHPDDSEAGSPFALPQTVIDFMGQAGLSRDVAEGTVLFRRGDPADAVVIVEQGCVEVHLDDGGSPRRLGQGSFLGELALLAPDGRRTATVVAGAGCRIKVVDRMRFDLLLAERPDLGCRSLRHACAYLIQSEGRVVASLERRNADLEQALDYLRRTREELDATEIRAQTDALSGLYNRRCLDRQLPRFLETERSDPQGVALLVIDLDKFKPVNDTHGHAAGDAVLRAVARTLAEQLRPTDLAFRLGGDEFAVLLAPVSVVAGFDAARSATSIRRRIESLEVHVPAAVLKVEATIGGSACTSGDSLETLMSRADKYLYAAKAAGRNLVCWEGEIVRDGP